MQKLFAIAIALLATCAISTDSRGQGAKDSAVSKLAHDGYWLKDRKEAYDGAMAMLDKPAPPLQLKDWHGTAVTDNAAKGKIVLIDFWATWCGPCIGQIPHANAISKKYADKGVVVFGACCPEGSETMADTAAKHGMEYPTGKMPEKATADWKIQFWPTYAVIDRQGNLRAIGLQPDYVEKVLDALVTEQPAK
ncbi:MAG TPA: TlpA disulfide reductase family protein [Tepidisphaeraceae bacterium]|nr:TlpA disulfide reductase family protein [Tepidisphaeraceae bacterium]